MEKLKNQLKIIDKKLVTSLIILVSTVYITVLYFNNLNINKDKISNWIVFFTVIFLEILLQIVFYIYTERQGKNIKIEKIFLTLIILFGTLYMVAVPIGKVPDEKAHFLRAYEVSKGHLISEVNEKGISGCELPAEIDEAFSCESYKEIKAMINKKQASENDKYYEFTAASVYSFVVYIPQTLGILVGRLLNLPIILIAYLARLFNLIFYIAIIYNALKLMPFYKKFFIAVSFLPITLQQACSISADSLTIATSFLLIAYIMNLAFSNQEKVTRKNTIFITVLSIIVALCKITYMPLVLLTLIIPKEKFENNKKKYLTIGIAFTITLMCNFIWLGIASRYALQFREGSNSGEQIKGILANPFGYIDVLYNTLALKGRQFLVTFLGQSLELLNLNLSALYPFIALLILGNAIHEENTIKITKYQKIIMAIVFVIIFVLIITALYVQCNPVGDKVAVGIQGRYFTPIIILLPMFIMKSGSKNEKQNEENSNTGMWIMLLMINLYAISKILIAHMI